MSEATDLVVIEKSNAMAVFTSKEQLDPLLEKIETEARSLVPDLTTKKGRDAIASMAHKVARSKTYIDNAGKDLVAELKALPKQIDESRRIVRERLDALKDEVRRPLTEWEAEQERIKAEEEMNAWHAEALEMNAEFDRQLAARREADHEMALLMNDKFDRDREEQRRQAEQAQRERDERLKQEAAEQARRDAEAKHKAEIEAAARREAEEKARAELAERQRIETEQRAEREKQEAAEQARRDAEAKHKAEIEAAARREAEEKARAELAERQRIETEQRAEREKQEAEARAEREKAAAVETERLKAKQAEEARLAEEKRIADEQAKREADVKHRKTVGTNIVNALTSHTSLTREQAIEVLTALKDDLIPCAKIHY